MTPIPETKMLEFNEKLIELVGKNRTLYDSTCEGYSNYQLQDETWRRIASELGEDVAACKLKWKNIRTCYTRYLRRLNSQNGRISKTYYLAEQLQFLWPFCKPNQRSTYDSPGGDESQFLQFEEPELGDVVLTKTEPLDEDDSNQNLDSGTYLTDEASTHSSEPNANKRQWDTGDFAAAKRTKTETCDESDLNFFRSLMPDIRKMNGKQKNKLKIAVLSAIDSILYSQ